MGLKDQFRSVIQWENPMENELFYRWSDRGDEIKNASKLIVGPGQGCIFVYEGKVEGLFNKEGLYELSTANIPFITTILKIMQAFESEHKTGFYFYKKTKILNQKWGTSSIIKYVDPKYNFPVGLRAFGNYTFTIENPVEFFTAVVGGSPLYTVENFRDVMSARIMQPLIDFFAEARLSYADIDAEREEISQKLNKKLSREFTSLGFTMDDFRIEGSSFDDDTMQRINRIGDVQAEIVAAQSAGLNYAQMQQVSALRDAANNDGGAGMGMGMMAGMGMGQGMMGGMAGGQQPAADPNDPMVKLNKLKEMLKNDLITQKEFDTKKKEILDSM